MATFVIPPGITTSRRIPASHSASRGYQGTFVGEEMLGDERDRLFGLATQYMPNYAGYQKTTKGRRIPVVAFTEVDVSK